MQNCINLVDISDEEDDDFDFVAQYRKLEKLQKEKANKNKPPPMDWEKMLSSSTSSNGNVTINLTESTSGITNAQRGLRRSRRSRNLAPLPTNVRILGPVISIGDFYDGYGEFPPREIKKDSKSDNDEDILANWEKRQIEEAQLEDAMAKVNHVMNIKVYWQQKRTYSFPLRMFQPISSIYEHFAKLESIEPSHVRLDLHKKTLSPEDTPNSINYKIVDFIDGSIEFYRSADDTPKVEEEPREEMVNYHIKQNNVKQPIIMEMKKTDNMLIMYIKLKELLNIELNSFKLMFDGEQVKFMDTMESLDLEGGECFELFFKE
ncbi:uncharacterized protein LOC112603948 isoform X2 [Melanaphis sacchari]|uniref:uncharacterized protein LOC112603948 isoform X2 n=1 Tax=Melanaphis sacchari TaxID=742174 RepID=UPI000DC149D8|nr:uncharacterized protein LOC112603948 isoform X2 [Melanaphis sacchari]